jgi:hypothetical protein
MVAFVDLLGSGGVKLSSMSRMGRDEIDTSGRIFLKPD